MDKNLIKTDRWNEGLEIARACAIILVFYSHGILLLEKSHWWNLINNHLGLAAFFKPGWWGVRIFFALSGYLISRQAIAVLSAGKRRDALHFAVRRWIRTVPTYWLILAISCISKGIGWFSPLAIKNALFLQSNSLLPGVSSIIDVSWSLVIEEWTYALIALFLVSCSMLRLQLRQADAARLLLAVTLLLCVNSSLARFNACSSDAITWEVLKKSANLQMDSLASGTFLACAEVLWPKTFTTWSGQKRLSTVIALGGMSLIGLWLNHHQFSEEVAAASQNEWRMLGLWIYPASNALSAIFLIACWNRSLKLSARWFNEALRYMARVSYSLYLVHLPVAIMAANLIHVLGVEACLFIYICISIILTQLSWTFFEKPFLRLRRYLR